MLAQEIKIRGEPTADPQKCRFVLDAEVLSRSPVSFDNESDTSKAPLAQKLLALPYIAGVSISGSAVTLTGDNVESCLLYTSPSPRDLSTSRMPSSA